MYLSSYLINKYMPDEIFFRFDQYGITLNDCCHCCTDSLRDFIKGLAKKITVSFIYSYSQKLDLIFDFGFIREFRKFKSRKNNADKKNNSKPKYIFCVIRVHFVLALPVEKNPLKDNYNWSRMSWRRIVTEDSEFDTIIKECGFIGKDADYKYTKKKVDQIIKNLHLCETVLNILFLCDEAKKEFRIKYELNSSFLAKLILPLIKAYRKQYIERDSFANNAPPGLTQGETDDEKKEWLSVIDDIIFSLRWHIEVDIINETSENVAFFEEYYGRYISFKEDWVKQFEQNGDSFSQSRKGFELFGKFFVRKSDIPDYDLINLDISIAKRILPKIKAYREMFLERHENLNDLINVTYATLQECLSDEEKERIPDKNDVDEFEQLSNAINEQCSEPEYFTPSSDLLKLPVIEMSDEVKAQVTANENKQWLAIIDKIIYAMRWCLEVDMLNETYKKTAFFKEYYGQYIPPEEDKDKHIEQYDDSLYRAKRGFMSFGYFLSNCDRNVNLFL
jgi:hypothetical protein